MSIPDRLWRVVKGHWALANEAQESIDRHRAAADAYEELAEVLRKSPPAPPAETTREGTPVLPQAPQRAEAYAVDPLYACYELLGVQPGSDLQSVDVAYNARMSELQPDRFPAGTPARTAVESRRTAVTAAYEKLRDVLNPTETRFERLEF